MVKMQPIHNTERRYYFVHVPKEDRDHVLRALTRMIQMPDKWGPFTQFHIERIFNDLSDCVQCYPFSFTLSVDATTRLKRELTLTRKRLVITIKRKDKTT